MTGREVNGLTPVLADFARPVLQPLADDTPLTRRREVLGLAVMVWHAVILRSVRRHHVAILLEEGAWIRRMFLRALRARAEATATGGPRPWPASVRRSR